MRHLENMQTEIVEIPADLVLEAGMDADDISAQATRLLDSGGPNRGIQQSVAPQ